MPRKAAEYAGVFNIDFFVVNAGAGRARFHVIRKQNATANYYFPRFS
jgi:hypothetical protein